jgi:hypothetical protein
MVAISVMSRWLPRDLTSMPLDQIDAEIAEIQARPPGQRTVDSTERLRDLHDARDRIVGSSRHRGRGRFRLGVNNGKHRLGL